MADLNRAIAEQEAMKRDRKILKSKAFSEVLPSYSAPLEFVLRGERHQNGANQVGGGTGGAVTWSARRLGRWRSWFSAALKR